MNPDDLKQTYQKNSQEQPPEHLDQSVLAMAKDELNQGNVINAKSKFPWRPLLATAASLTLVVSIVIQQIPSEQATLQNPPVEVIQIETVQGYLEEQEVALKAEEVAKKRTTEKNVASKRRAANPIVASASETLKPEQLTPRSKLVGSSESDQKITVTGSRILSADMETVKQQVILENKNKAKQKISKTTLLESPAVEEHVLSYEEQQGFFSTTESAKKELNAIQKLLDEKQLDMAQKRWKRLNELQPKLSKNPELTTLWLKIKQQLQRE